ncbi:DUF1652 domain-containing protein [Pseudomonas sp. 15FMM2]|uniref:DUF1652 domain-containing protein n=1 Tax=Pseudomonas imrae TaxID=2992837 RepID=A0ACC7PNT3_9PSED
MNNLGLSILELRCLIEKAFLPDRCICECPDGKTLHLELSSFAQPTVPTWVTSIPISDLDSFRVVADLIAKARYELTCAHAQPAARQPASRY